MTDGQQGDAREPEIVVEFDHVALSFDEKVVLRDVSFRLHHGETKIILGVSGSGKSVLLKLTMGLLRPDSGRILVLGRDITQMTEAELFGIRRKIGMVFQESALFDSITVGDNVAFVFERMPDVPPDEVIHRVSESLRFVELEETLNLMPSELSGGMRRRVAIARAVVGRPRIMLYDSPTGGLDPITAARIMTLIIKQRDVSAVSSLLVTQRIRDAYLMAESYYDARQGKLMPASRNGHCDVHTRFLMLRAGDIVFHGTLEEMHSQKDAYVRNFLT